MTYLLLVHLMLHLGAFGHFELGVLHGEDRVQMGLWQLEVFGKQRRGQAADPGFRNTSTEKMIV